MGPKKSRKEPQDKENNAQSKIPAKKQASQPNKLTNANHENQQTKIDGERKKTGPETKEKFLEKKLETGKGPNANVKWVLEGQKLYKAVGNKVTLVKQEPSIFGYSALAMLIEDGAAPVSEEHFWTVNYGGLYSEYPRYPLAGVTNSRWFKEQTGLFYSGTLSKWHEQPKVEFGPLINPGDVIGILCSFSGKDLKVYFYHNRRCLGLSFQVPASLFLPEGICPSVRLGEVGTWATIEKEPREKIPKEKDRIRAPVGQFGAEGIWRFKNLVDSKSGNEIPLKIKEKILKRGDLTITQEEKDPSSWYVEVSYSLYACFTARKMEHNLWIKTESHHHMGGTRRRRPQVYDRSLFPDFPIVEILSNPEKVDFQDQEMRVTKGERTVIFHRFYKIRKGNVFKNEHFD